MKLSIVAKLAFILPAVLATNEELARLVTEKVQVFPKDFDASVWKRTAIIFNEQATKLEALANSGKSQQDVLELVKHFEFGQQESPEVGEALEISLGATISHAQDLVSSDGKGVLDVRKMLTDIRVPQDAMWEMDIAVTRFLMAVWQLVIDDPTIPEGASAAMKQLMSRVKA